MHGREARVSAPRTTKMMNVHRLLLALATSLALAAPLSSAQTDSPPRSAQPANAQPKVLRYAFRIAETSFDPAYITDLYSRIVAGGIFDAPLRYDFLARPARVKPNTAAAMPEVADNYKSFTFHIRPGIYFADDPAFKGKKRELTAADYVYSMKRHYDPRWKSGNLYILENAKILGLSELRQEALDTKKPFDYEREVEGLKVLDRYTFRIRLAAPSPRLLLVFGDGSFLGAVAREVVEAYGDRVGDHPVGTGAFRLAAWRRSSRIVLERNPDYREDFYDEQAPEGDAHLQAIAAAYKGRRLPMIDRVEISIIEENQPRWLAFLNGEQDLLEEVPPEFANIAMPNGKLAPNLKKQGIWMERYPRADVSLSYFGMENPVVGGYTPQKVALRRAISLAVDVDQEIRLVRRNQAIPAQSIIGPETWGYDPSFKSEMSEFDRAKARALLDTYGYVDRDGDGWRDQPDGSPLVIEYATQPDQQSRQLIEQWQKNMAAIGLRIVFKPAKWPENLKASRSGKLMMWGVGWSAAVPDCEAFLELAYGPNKGQANHARFDLPAYNRLHEQQKAMPDGPERMQVVNEAKRLLVAYMPYKVHVHRVFTDLAQPWVKGYHRNVFVRDFWKYIDVDNAELQHRQAP
jgi:ABC-type transport system substrate-binding protein